MKFSTFASAAVVAATAVAKDVSCRVDGKEVAQVDLDSGKCPFKIPSKYPVKFDYKDDDDYEVDAYYVNVDDKYWNDIENEGRTIDVPAKALYNKDAAPLFHVHDEHTPASNSSSAMRKRFSAQLNVRADKSSVVDSVKKQSGKEIPVKVQVVDPSAASSSAPTSSGSGTVTHTNSETTLVTVTSCSDNKCHESTATSQWGPTTVTVSDETTVLTTWCPVTATETNTHTTLVTVTSCADNKCHETTAPATWGPTTSTVEGTETVYTTWCPVSTATQTNTDTTIVTVTSCDDNKCHQSTKPATWGPTTSTVEGTETVYTTWCPVESTTAAPAASTAKPTTEAPKPTGQGTEGTHTVYSTVVCENEKCQTHTKTGAQSVVTVTSNGETTQYTTVCPIEESSSVGKTTNAGEESTFTTVVASTQPAPAPTGNGTPGQPAQPASQAPAPGGSQPAQPAQPSQAPAPGGSQPTQPAQPSSAPAQPAPAGSQSTVAGQSTAPPAPGASSSPTGAAPASTLQTSSVAAESSPAVNSVEASAGKLTGSLLALLAIPFAYLL